MDLDLNDFKDKEETPKQKEAEVKSNVTGLELYSDSHPFRLALRIRNFDGEASYKKFVKNCEMLVRRCNEYKLWREYIVDVLQHNTCMITNESMEQVGIEIHHHMPGLFVLVSALVNRKLEQEQEFCSFDIAQEAIELHFQNKIGYVVLLKSMHEKFHNGYLTIPNSFIKGDYQYFLNEFSKYMDDDANNLLQSRLAIDEHNCTWARDDYPAANFGG